MPADRFFGQTFATYTSSLIPILWNRSSLYYVKINNRDRQYLPVRYRRHCGAHTWSSHLTALFGPSTEGRCFETTMAQLQMGVWAGIAASGVMVMLVLLPILGCIFSRNKKTKKAVDLEESAAEKGEIIYSAPALAQTPAPTRPINAILQKPATHFSQHEIRKQPSTQSISPSYQSQSSTLAPGSPLRKSTPSPPLQPHLQPMWTKPSP